MSTLEYAEFVEELISTTVEVFNSVSYHTYIFKPTKIKIKIFGKNYNDIEFYKFKNCCASLGIKYRAQFEKFNISSTPQLYFCPELKTVTIKWFVNIDQWQNL